MENNNTQNDSKVKVFLKKLGNGMDTIKKISTLNIDKLPIEADTLYADRTIKIAKSIANLYYSKIVPNFNNFIEIMEKQYNNLYEKYFKDLDVELDKLDELRKTQLQELTEKKLNDENCPILYEGLKIMLSSFKQTIKIIAIEMNKKIVNEFNLKVNSFRALFKANF